MPVSSSRLNTLVVPVRSQVEAIRSDTGARQSRSGMVGGNPDLAQRRYGKIARTAIRQALIEGMIDSPARAGFIEDDYLCTLRAL